jgi:hemerythrin-like metal-binding protein
MTTTTWNPALETGHADIDHQHRTLFARADRLIEAVQGGSGDAEVAYVFRFLREYVHEHFKAEEGLMHRHGYPEVELHAGLHQQIRHRLDDMLAAYERDGGSLALLRDVEAMMRGWLSQHIGEKDRAFANYLRSQNHLKP